MQQMWTGCGFHLPAPLPGAEKIQYVQMEVMEAKAFEEKEKEFGKIFLR